ncbi:MAG: hypothetical protein QM647_08890 [Asticcacaulis sp.]|uniref:hypothetical protein n=1 Tax=Asticcacaulis sp. TaxID=1872648 RepID=UPI0039E6310D
MTDDADTSLHPASPDEAQASLRASLERQIERAQAALETQLAELRRAGLLDSNPALAEEMRGQLQILSSLSRFLPSVPLSALRQVQAEVATSVAAAGNLANQSQSLVTMAGVNGTADRMAELATASAAARQTTQDFMHDFYEKRIFDPYLHFASPEDEKEYREREAARQRAIEKAQAENTTEGNLVATKLAEEQLKDAGAHGADRSPQYRPSLDRLHQSATNLSASLSDEQNRNVDAAMSAALPKKADHSEAAANLKNAGVVVADQSQTGHGVTIDASLAAALGRC